LKGFLTSKMVSVCTLFVLLTAVAFFSGNIVSPHAASAASRVSQHGTATPLARLSARSSPSTSGGKLRWRYLTGDVVESSPAVVNGVVYVGSGDDYVYALNASNGTLRWRYLTGNSVYSSPKVVNGVVYVGSYDDYVYALNASNGTLRWRYLTGNTVYSSPKVVNGVVYVGSFDDYVYTLTA
jgi:hypothetical protein